MSIFKSGAVALGHKLRSSLTIHGVNEVFPSYAVIHILVNVRGIQFSRDSTLLRCWLSALRFCTFTQLYIRDALQKRTKKEIYREVTFSIVIIVVHFTVKRKIFPARYLNGSY